MAVTSMANSSIRDFQKYRNASAFYGTLSDSVEHIVIAGGASGGGYYYAGGGGAGGYRSSVTGESSGGGFAAEGRLALSGTYTLTVGAGGAQQNASAVGNDGSDSVFASITSIGGGGGGNFQNNGRPGGSGGGAATSYTFGAGTVGQGFQGGEENGVGASSRGGGGGGAGEVGGTATSSQGGNGVDPVISHDLICLCNPATVSCKW